MDGGENVNESITCRPAAKKARRTEVEALLEEPNTNTARNQSRGQRMTTANNNNSNRSTAETDDDPSSCSVTPSTVEEGLETTNLEGMLQRELALSLIRQQQQQQQQQQFIAPPLFYQPVLPCVQGLPLTIGGIAMAPLVNMPPPYLPQSNFNYNFALPTQLGAIGGHPINVLSQPVTTRDLASAQSLLPAFAMNLLGQNYLDGSRTGQNLHFWAAAGHRQPQPQPQPQLAHQHLPTTAALRNGLEVVDWQNQHHYSNRDAEEGNQQQRTPPLDCAAAGSAHHHSHSHPHSPHPRVIPMAVDSDENCISKFQCILRKQIEFFEATEVDLGARAQGRNQPIRLKQVGIRCIHCASIPAGHRPRGAVYFPMKLESLYQSTQNMAHNHFNGTSCTSTPSFVLDELQRHKASSRLGNGVQRYWIETARQRGLVDSEVSGIVFQQQQQQHRAPHPEHDRKYKCHAADE